MKDKVGGWKNKVLGTDKGLGEENEHGEVGKPSLRRWPHHQRNVLVIAAIHYGPCHCLVQDQVPHPSLSASGTSMTKP